MTEALRQREKNPANEVELQYGTIKQRVLPTLETMDETMFTIPQTKERRKAVEVLVLMTVFMCMVQLLAKLVVVVAWDLAIIVLDHLPPGVFQGTSSRSPRSTNTDIGLHQQSS